MSRKKVSQREARGAIKQLKQLRHVMGTMLDDWCEEYPGGRALSTIDLKDCPRIVGALQAIQCVRMPLVCRLRGETLTVYAINKQGVLQ